MLHKQIILRLCLLMLTGISCGIFSRAISSPTPTEDTGPGLFNLEEALTLALQAIRAETPDTETAAPVTETAAPATSTASPMPDSTNAAGQFATLGEHRVAPGETISCIGRAYRVSPKAIADANGLDLLSELRAGQVLLIPSVQWTAISAGPVCKPQFTPPNWETVGTQQSQPTRKPEEESGQVEIPVSGATEAPVSQATEPPVSGPTDPPVSEPTDPPVIVLPRPCPPFCIIRPTIIVIDPPTEPPLPPTEPPPTTES